MSTAEGTVNSRCALTDTCFGGVLTAACTLGMEFCESHITLWIKICSGAEPASSLIASMKSLVSSRIMTLAVGSWGQNAVTGNVTLGPDLLATLPKKVQRFMLKGKGDQKTRGHACGNMRRCVNPCVAPPWENSPRRALQVAGSNASNSNIVFLELLLVTLSETSDNDVPEWSLLSWCAK